MSRPDTVTQFPSSPVQPSLELLNATQLPQERSFPQHDEGQQQQQQLLQQRPFAVTSCRSDDEDNSDCDSDSETNHQYHNNNNNNNNNNDLESDHESRYKSIISRSGSNGPTSKIDLMK
eukprot:Awhi_evm1s10208